VVYFHRGRGFRTPCKRTAHQAAYTSGLTLDLHGRKSEI
jgi:hypothetical protein